MLRRSSLSPSSAFRLQFLVRGLSLASFTAAQLVYPLARNLILARILSAFEFGFASALAASYATFELVTDVAIHRFVLATPREEYQAALAGAHGLSVLRGALAGMLATAAAPALAYIMSLRNDWTSFAWLGLAIFIRSFEHFEIRVAERDYRYNAQLLMNLLANTTALGVMVATWFYAHNHVIYLTMLFAQNIVYVVASHCLAKTKYRVDWRSPYLRKAARFAYPLVLSGIGLAIVSQGDRLFVGSVLDLPTLGVYSVIMLTVTVPIGALGQIASSLALAGLHNAAADPERQRCRLLLYMRIMHMLGVCFAFGLLAFMNVLVPAVFGPRFTIESDIVDLLALVAFLNISRSEPTTSALLVNHRTRLLAVLSLSGGVGLLAAAVLAFSYKNLSMIVWGRLIGECFGFVVTMSVLRQCVGPVGLRAFGVSVWSAVWIVAGIFLTVLHPMPLFSPLRLGLLGCLALACIAGLALNMRPLLVRAYGLADTGSKL